MFITFEGIDGCGKTTQAKKLYKKLLEDKGILKVKTPYLTKEPGDTLEGALRHIIVNKDSYRVYDDTELLLYIADRVNHINETLNPLLKSETIVICDRFHDSTLAYQLAKSVKIHKGDSDYWSLFWALDKYIKKKVVKMPDITFFLDISPDLARNRLLRDDVDDIDDMERDYLKSFEAVKDRYHGLAWSDQERIKIIGVNGLCEEEVHAKIMADLRRNKLYQEILKEVRND